MLAVAAPRPGRDDVGVLFGGVGTDFVGRVALADGGDDLVAALRVGGLPDKGEGAAAGRRQRAFQSVTDVVGRGLDLARVDDVDGVGRRVEMLREVERGLDSALGAA